MKRLFLPTVDRRALERLSAAAPASLATSLFLVVAVASYIRLYFTIDFTDEALYTAIPYRFVLGDRPFIDEWNMAQLAGLILYPFVKAFILARNSTEWIILYTRHVAFGLSALVSITVFLSLKGHVGRNAALLFSVLPVVFVPYNLLGPGYNALGGGFLTAGVFLAWDPARRAHNGLWIPVAGLAHGLAVFSYPTLLVPSLCFLAFLIGTAPHKVKTFLLYGVGALVGPGALLLAFRVHVQDVLAASNYAFAIAKVTEHDWTLNKLWVLPRALWNGCPYKPLLIAVLLVLLVAVKKDMPRVASFVILGWPMVLFHCTRSGLGGPGTMGFLAYNGLVGFVVFCCLTRDKLHWRLLLGVWLPSVVAGATMAWSSGMGIGASAIAMVPANIVTMCFAASLLQQTAAGPGASTPLDYAAATGGPDCGGRPQFPPLAVSG